MAPKRIRFCEEYLIDLNAASAAIRAGYSEKTAKSIGSELLTFPDVQALLKEKRKEISTQTGISQERVLKELARIAFSDARRVMKWGPGGVTLIDSASLSDEDAAAVAEASESTSKDGGSIKLKMHDKLGALDKIARHLGMYVDKMEHSGPNGQRLEVVIRSVLDPKP